MFHDVLHYISQIAKRSYCSEFFHSRSKDIVEPLLKPQWYVDCREMAANSVKVFDLSCWS